MEKPNNNSPCFFTQQLFLIGTYNEDGSENFAPISWVSYTWGEPSCLIISMHGQKKTAENFERTLQLSATVVTPELMTFAEVCGSHENKERFFHKVKPRFARGEKLDVPLIEDSKWSFECRLNQSVKIGEVTTYFAEVVNINVAEEVLKLDFVDLRKINPVLYSPMNYFTIGGHLGRMGEFSQLDEIGYCGLKCYECAVYLATASNDDALKQKLAEEYSNENWKLTKDDINCRGCHLHESAENKMCHGCPIRPCAETKGVYTCADCPDYPCQITEKFVPEGSDGRKTLESLRCRCNGH